MRNVYCLTIHTDDSAPSNSFYQDDVFANVLSPLTQSLGELKKTPEEILLTNIKNNKNKATLFEIYTGQVQGTVLVGELPEFQRSKKLITSFTSAQYRALASEPRSIGDLCRAFPPSEVSVMLSTSTPSSSAETPLSVSLLMAGLGLTRRDDGMWVGDKVESGANYTQCNDLRNPEAVKTALIAYMAQELAKKVPALSAEDIQAQAQDTKNWHTYGIKINLVLDASMNPTEKTAINQAVNETLKKLNSNCQLGNWSELKQQVRQLGSENPLDYSPEQIKTASGVEDMIHITAADVGGVSNDSAIAARQVHAAVMLHWDSQPIKLQINYGNHHGYYVIQDNQMLVVNSMPEGPYQAVDFAAHEAFVRAYSRIQLLASLTGKEYSNLLTEIKLSYGYTGEGTDLEEFLEKNDLLVQYMRGDELSNEQIAELANEYLRLKDTTAQTVQTAREELPPPGTLVKTEARQTDSHACGPIVVEAAKKLDEMIGEAGDKRLNFDAMRAAMDEVITETCANIDQVREEHQRTISGPSLSMM